jgi:hypothetical protein
MLLKSTSMEKKSDIISSMLVEMMSQELAVMFGWQTYIHNNIYFT